MAILAGILGAIICAIFLIWLNTISFWLAVGVGVLLIIILIAIAYRLSK